MKPNVCPCSCDLPFLESVDFPGPPHIGWFLEWQENAQRLLVLLFKLSPAYAMTD